MSKPLTHVRPIQRLGRNRRSKMTSYIKRTAIIGEGSYSKVYRCEYSPDSTTIPVTECAVKYIPSDPDGLSCVNELTIMYSFNHINLMTATNIIYDHIDPTGVSSPTGHPTIIIVMELAERSLEGFKASLEEVRQVTYDVACGLKVLHEAGYIHGDIKPSNILKCQHRHKITDFSITTTTLIKNHGCICTYPYRPPEVIGGRRVWNEKVDVWALGTTIFELAFGQRLFPTQNDTDERVIEPKLLNAIADWATATQQDNAIVRAPVEYRTFNRPPNTEHSAYAMVFDFVRQCCQIDPTKRPSVNDLLMHPFINYQPQLTYRVVQYSTVKTMDRKSLDLLVHLGQQYSLEPLVITYAARIVMITQALTNRFPSDQLVKVAYLLTLKALNHQARGRYCRDQLTDELRRDEANVMVRLRYTLPVPRSMVVNQSSTE